MALIGVEAGDGPSWLSPAPPQGGLVKKYNVVVNGVQTTLLLNDEDAKRRGLLAAAEKPAAKAAKAPANKARPAAANKQD
ncbi:hypothetical protein BST24_02800 [Mycobacteroides franklinii]|nr:hypothetical protein BST24_02800 [Mycobacteroides franklinii]